MSEDYLKSESYLRGANNDLMDPNWKPTFKKEITALTLVENLITSFLNIKYAFEKTFNDKDDIEMNKSPHNYEIKISISYSRYLEIQKAIKDYEDFRNITKKEVD